MEESIEKQTTIFNRSVDAFFDKLPSFVIALVTILIGVIIAKMVKKALTRMLYKYKSSVGIISFLINLSQVLIIMVAFIQALGGLGVNTTSFAAILGAAGFSIGLAFKEVLANFGSSMIILFFKPFDVGDYILCDNVEGSVFEIQMFSTTLKTVDNKLIIVPNSMITSNPVINYTSQDRRRIDFAFNFEYDTDVKKLYEIADSLFGQESRILKSPAPLLGVDSMENNMIRFIARPWVKTDDYWDVYYKLMEEFKHEFDSNNIKLSRINIINNN
ncbi:mechanosensitive ion channel family protein [Peptostreptococcus russellii]|uniref:mechanosensitive ion channel family protein n=1 Tax=Peptostreptococcus russellii TaxID=215200 RepID=UPI003F58740A